MWWGYVAALGGALLYAAASITQGYAARRASGAAVLRHPAYLVGLVCDGLAWLVSLVALAVLPLFVVQSLLAGSVALTVLFAVPFLHICPTRREIVAIGVVTAGLLGVSASAAAESTQEPPSWFATALLVGVGILAVGALLSYRRGAALPSAVAAGLGFSGAALGARAGHLGEQPWLTTVENPLTWAVVVSGILGAVMYARALEGGAVGPVTAVLWVVEVVVPGIIGVLALGDAVRPGWEAPALLGVACAIGGCLVLAQSPAQG